MRAQSVTLDRFKQNLRTLALTTVPHSTPVLLITPPPFGEAMRRVDVDRRFPDEKLELDRTIERTRSFARAVREVVDELKVKEKKGAIALVEVHDAIEDAALADMNGDREKGLERYLSDGLHLTGDGYRVSVPNA